MFYLFFCLLGMITVGFFRELSSLILIGIFLLGLLLSSFKRYPLKKILISVLVFIIGSSYYIAYDEINMKFNKYVNKNDVLLTVEVLSEPDYSKTPLTFTGKVKGYNKKANITLFETTYFSSYDTLTFVGDISSVTSDREAMYSNGIYYIIKSADKDIEVKYGKGILKAIYDFKNKIIFELDNNFSYETSMFLKGVLIGDDSSRTNEFDNALKNLSLSHIVCVSGMHFSIITMALLFIFRRLRIGRKTASLLTIPISFVLALFIGFTPSVIRVLIMTTILSVADLIDKDRVSDVYLLLLTALIMMIYNVYYIHNISFVLSFLSLGGIFTLTKRISPFLKVLPVKIRESVSITLAANLYTFPAVVFYFKGVPLLTVLANLIIVPFMSYIMVYGIIVVVISMISLKLGHIAGIPLDVITTLCVKFINFAGNIPFTYFETLYIDKYFICIYYIGIYIISVKPLGLSRKILFAVLFIYFSVNLFFPLDKFLLPYGDLYVMCGENSGKGILVYKDKTVFINASGINGKYYYDLINEEYNGHFNIYIAFNDVAIKYLDEHSINADTVYVPHDFIYNDYYNTVLNKKCKKIVPVKEKISISFYDFNLTLKPEDSYNILYTSISHKDEEIFFLNGYIEQIRYNTKYVLSYFMLDEYDKTDCILNCKKEEIERIKI